LKLLPTIFCVRFSQQSSISRRRFSSRWLHLVSIRCIATIGFSYHYSLRSASSDPKDQTIVCPKLRVSPLNAQTEFKVFSMQTIPSLQRLGTVCFMIVRSSVSYFFLAFLPSFIGLIVSPLPLQFRLGFLEAFRFRHHLDTQCLTCAYNSPVEDWSLRYLSPSQFTSETIVFKLKSLSLGLFACVCNSVYTPLASFLTFRPFGAPKLSIFQVFQPEWSAYCPFPIRVTLQPRNRRGDRVIYACRFNRVLRFILLRTGVTPTSLVSPFPQAHFDIRR
jgi:hypothetical protein